MMLHTAGVELVELHAVADIFASGLGEVEDVGGGCYRFTLYAKQRVGNGEELVIVAKIVMPLEAVPPALALAAKAVGCAMLRGAYVPEGNFH